jgi:FkbM family methyltransferase
MINRILREKNPIKFLLSRLIGKSGLGVLLSMKIRRPGYKLNFYNSSISINLWYNPKDRLDDVYVITSLLDVGDVFVDIGANIGDLAIAAAEKVGKNGVVYAIEPHPKTYSYLLGNITLNKLKNIHTLNTAAGSEIKWVNFTDYDADDMNKIGSGTKSILCMPMNLVIKERRIKLIKIDVEGFEYDVLKGLGNILNHAEAIFFEIGDEYFEKYNFNYSDIEDLLNKYGFRVFKKNSLDKWELINESNNSFPRIQNLIALKKKDAILIL